MTASQARVLVVDDEKTLANMLAVSLRLSGFDVQTAYCGEDAVPTARTFVPDFVISDFSMAPGMNGFESCVQIKKMIPGCRVLMLSGQYLAEEFAPFHSKGYDFPLLSKPIHPEELVRIIHSNDVAYLTDEHPHVLNVDDVEAHRYSISRLFSRAGFEVSEAGTGMDAIRKVFESRPDVVLLDIGLPDLDGYRVCSELRHNPETSRIAIIHVSASHATSESAALSAKAGADAFFPYPITPSQLVHSVREMLQLRYLNQSV